MTAMLILETVGRRCQRQLRHVCVRNRHHSSAPRARANRTSSRNPHASEGTLGTGAAEEGREKSGFADLRYIAPADIR